ncbi:MAG TPA: hypothetical protein VJN22_03545 [Candidatus Eremiobacteraceae bacterium]|nr:hypothetical protein [Candidatus Eremiobacteraceae bacterium]
MNTYRTFALSFVASIAICGGGCSNRPPATNGYSHQIVPGITREQVEAVAGKPISDGPFNLDAIHAELLPYPFGQVILSNGRVIVVTIAKDPAYVGPFGVAPGVMDDQFQASLKAHKGHRTGHTDSYDVIVKEGETRTRDWYDTTDNLMVEFAATNANDPLAPYQIVAVNLANSAGMTLLQEIVKSKLRGEFPDQRVVNFVSEPWST